MFVADLRVLVNCILNRSAETGARMASFLMCGFFLGVRGDTLVGTIVEDVEFEVIELVVWLFTRAGLSYTQTASSRNILT